MKNIRNISLFILALMVATLGASAADNASALDKNHIQVNGMQIPLNQALVLSGGESSNPREYDPATTHSSGDKLVFSGLVSLDPNLNLTPDIAETWDLSADGTVYTFHLRENARFHDGRAVTAQDVIYSWERAASPDLQSDTVITYLGDIVGVKEKFSGKASTISGLQAIDDLTLQVTIDASKPYFLLKLTYATAFVLDEQNINEGTNWYRTPNGTGPFRLTEWKKAERIVYERNEDFYLGAPSIPFVVVNLYAGGDVQLYETGDVDMAGVGIYDADRFLSPEEPMHAELVGGVGLCTNYVVFDTTQPPFDDVKVRQAFTMAFNREQYIDVVLNGQALPANGLYPPGLPGFTYDLEGLPYDPARAKQLLAESKYGGAEGLPKIFFTTAGVGSYIGPDISALAQMWQLNLGVTITVENIEFDHYFDQIYSGNHGQLFDGGWCADYPDPENFADVLLHSGAQQNLGQYSNPELDALLEAARVEKDVTKRMEMYQEAQRIIVNDAPLMFSTHALGYELVKPYVKGYVKTPIAIPIERYMWLEGK